MNRWCVYEEVNPMKRMLIYIAVSLTMLIVAGSVGGMTLGAGSNPAQGAEKNKTTQLLGAHVRILDREQARQMGMPDERALLVVKVEENTPAELAGLKQGDIITALDGKDLHTPLALAFNVGRLLAGETVDIAVWRDGLPLTLQLTAAGQSDPPPEQFGLKRMRLWDAAREKERIRLDQLGITVVDLTRDLSERYSFPDRLTGVVIVDVERGSPADFAGLQRGDLIQQANGKRVLTAKDAQKAVAAGSLRAGVILQIHSEDEGVSLVMIRDADDN
jgi:serine protease Do